MSGVGLAWAQQPFITDDADVTSKRRFHFELSNQYSALQRSALPNQRQNALVYQLNYGLFDGLEIGIDSPYLTIINVPGSANPRVVSGPGDTNVTLKWNFLREKPAQSKRPALTLAYALELPTGDTRKQLGTGIYDHRFVGVLQKTLAPGWMLRVNQGVLISGNTLTGVVGLRNQGLTYLWSASVTRNMTDRLVLGAEAGGASAPLRTADGIGSRSALHQQFGGKLRLAPGATFDFGVVAGQLGESPRAALQIGLSLDF